eukprot:maker-scaffold416_size178335-snap-gene-0.23 protein:Tk04593 transcript:maker-scaffold416_size178335-snap-gene-0.23-mRNA-1 annotation:"mec2-like protein"
MVKKRSARWPLVRDNAFLSAAMMVSYLDEVGGFSTTCLTSWSAFSSRARTALSYFDWSAVMAGLASQKPASSFTIQRSTSLVQIVGGMNLAEETVVSAAAALNLASIMLVMMVWRSSMVTGRQSGRWNRHLRMAFDGGFVVHCHRHFAFLLVCMLQEYERAVIFRLGRLLDGGSKGPGIFFVLPCIESYQKVDLRTITLDVPPQEVLTRDSVTVSVDAVVYYRVSNATVSVANVENAHHSTRLLAQTTLRNILGTKNLHEILSDRESISASMQVGKYLDLYSNSWGIVIPREESSALDEATEPWGIKVERVEIKDVRLPVQLQRAMAAEAEAAREARAKVIAAEGEQKASRALREAADVISMSPSAIQLRYLQTLNSISAEKNSTIIFPIPLDLISTLMKRN